MDEETYTYDPSLERKWKEGSLQKEWLEKYPTLFTRSDYEVVRNQSQYHFGEWFVAIKYHEKGWKVLVEQYMFPKHKKLEVLRKLIGEENLNTIQAAGAGKTQAPDLFVYNDRGDYFFVEVKKQRDRLTNEQEKHFKRIGKVLNTKIIIAKVLPTE